MESNHRSFLLESQIYSLLLWPLSDTSVVDLNMAIRTNRVTLFQFFENVVQRITQPDSLADVEAFSLGVAVVEL